MKTEDKTEEVFIMELSKFEKAVATIKKNQDAYACPICKTRMKITKSGRLICKKEHTFDVSKKGYVNLINESKKTNYDKELFVSRKGIFSQGFYQPVSDEIKNIVLEYMVNKNIQIANILDVGCGEGYYSNQLSCVDKLNIFAFDISKDAISLATDYSREINWCIADLSNLPFKDRSMDIIVDVLTPANYKEFKRVLNNQGLLIKVVPGDEYLKEIRNAVSGKLKSKSYSNKDTVEYSKSNIKLLGTKKIKYTLPVSPEQAMDFLKMTPMTSHIGTEEIDIENIKEITICMEIFYGKVK